MTVKWKFWVLLNCSSTISLFNSTFAPFFPPNKVHFYKIFGLKFSWSCSSLQKPSFYSEFLSRKPQLQFKHHFNSYSILKKTKQNQKHNPDFCFSSLFFVSKCFLEQLRIISSCNTLCPAHLENFQSPLFHSVICYYFMLKLYFCFHSWYFLKSAGRLVNNEDLF